MTTSEHGDKPEIEWTVNDNHYALIESHGEIEIYPATGESEDGRKWIADAEVLYGEDVEIDLNSIQEDK